MINFTYFNTLFLCVWLQVINKFIHQGEGHIKEGQSKISTSLQMLCSPYFLQAGGLHSTECILVSFALLLSSHHTPFFSVRAEIRYIINNL